MTVLYVPHSGRDCLICVNLALTVLYVPHLTVLHVPVEEDKGLECPFESQEQRRAQPRDACEFTSCLGFMVHV